MSEYVECYENLKAAVAILRLIVYWVLLTAPIVILQCSYLTVMGLPQVFILKV